MISFSALLRDKRASSASEFALVLPLLIIFLIGIIDVGRFLWVANSAEKAAQMGVRYAVVTTPVSAAISSYNFVTSGEVIPGEAVPVSVFGSLTCTYTVKSGASSCSNCTGMACSSPGANFTTSDNIRFSALVSYMGKFFSKINRSTDPSNENAKIIIVYNNSGLGYAGDPSGLSISPIVTVQMTGFKFTPTLFNFLGSPNINLPNFQSSLTMEDGQGTTSN